jgi:serine/threonine protein phosphatase PrpC
MTKVRLTDQHGEEVEVELDLRSRRVATQDLRHIEIVSDLTPNKEDTFLLGDNIYGVFDGAGSLVKFVDPKRGTGGRIAATIARDIFIRHEESSLAGLATFANAGIKREMMNVGIDVSKKVNLWCTTAAVVRMDENSFEWLQIGDSVILLIKSDGTFELLVPYHDHDQELLSVCKALSEKGEKDPHAIIVADGQAQALREKINVTFGDFTGEDEAMRWVKSGTRSLEGIDYILLYTDGLLIPKEDPKAPNDWGKTVQLFLEGGLGNIARHVRIRQDGDPFCAKYTRYRQYDDIAAIALSRKT